jgi:hypothetical protein
VSARRRALLGAAAVMALALSSGAATCRGEGSGGQGSDGEAVPAPVEPAQVEIDWPDAAVMPPPAGRVAPSEGPNTAADAGA